MSKQVEDDWIGLVAMLSCIVIASYQHTNDINPFTQTAHMYVYSSEWLVNSSCLQISWCVQMFRPSHPDYCLWFFFLVLSLLVWHVRIAQQELRLWCELMYETEILMKNSHAFTTRVPVEKLSPVGFWANSMIHYDIRLHSKHPNELGMIYDWLSIAW